MSYTSISRGLLTLVLLNAAPATVRAEAVGPPPPAAMTSPVVRPPALLKIESDGHAHFEIEGEAIVASYTDGVEASYRGYTLRCTALRLNQQTQTAQLTGQVEVSGPQVQFSTHSIELDILGGTAAISGGLRGSLEPGQLSFEAGEAQLALLDPTAPAGIGNVRAELTGNVLLSTATGSQLGMPRALYDGTTRRLSVPGQFVAKLALADRAPAGVPAGSANRNDRSYHEKTAAPAPGFKLDGPVQFVGSNLVALFEVDGALRSAGLESPRLAVAGAQFRADTAEMQAHGTGRKLTSFDLTLRGSPLAGSFDNGSRPLWLTANELTCSIASGQAQSVALHGDVRLSSQGLSGTTDELTFREGAQGQYLLAFPHGIRASGNISALTGNQVYSLDQLRLGKK